MGNGELKHHYIHVYKLHGTPFWRDGAVKVVAGQITANVKSETVKLVKINLSWSRFLISVKGCEEIDIYLHFSKVRKSDKFLRQCSWKILSFENSAFRWSSNERKWNTMVQNKI